jgi:hypothetical protein
MTNDEYQTTQQQVLFLAGLTLKLNLDDFLADISRADVWGSILDPTLYRKSQQTMHEIKEIAEAVRDLQKVAKRERKIREG